MTDNELKDLIAQLAIKTDKELNKLKEAQLKTDEQLKKTDEELNRLREAQLKTDEQLKKTDEELNRLREAQLKTDEQLRKLAEQIGGIGNNQGAVAEEYFYNSLKERMKLLNIKFDDIGLNWKKSKNGIEDEFDIILVNSKYIAIIEVKYKAHKNDVEKLDKKIENFRRLFPEYSHLKLYAGVASFHIYEEAKELAKQKGYFVLQRNGNIIEEYTTDNLKVA